MLQDVGPFIKPLPGIQSYSQRNTEKFRQFNAAVLGLERERSGSLCRGSDRCFLFNEVLDQTPLTC